MLGGSGSKGRRDVGVHRDCIFTRSWVDRVALVGQTYIYQCRYNQYMVTISFSAGVLDADPVHISLCKVVCLPR